MRNEFLGTITVEPIKRYSQSPVLRIHSVKCLQDVLDAPGWKRLHHGNVLNLDWLRCSISMFSPSSIHVFHFLFLSFTQTTLLDVAVVDVHHVGFTNLELQVGRISLSMLSSPVPDSTWL